LEGHSSFKIDYTDQKIIELLKNDAKISQTKIAETLSISRPTVQKRIKDLEDNDVIKFSIIINEKKLGKQITAFILVVLDRARRVWDFTYQEILNRMEELEINEFHHITGSEDVILKMKTRNIDSLEANLIKVTEIKGVSRTRTLICLSSVEKSFITKRTLEMAEEYKPQDMLWVLT
jgi:Lrp/AsnC family leucine-responsive transcriptional regulator